MKWKKTLTNVQISGELEDVAELLAREDVLVVLEPDAVVGRGLERVPSALNWSASVKLRVDPASRAGRRRAAPITTKTGREHRVGEPPPVEAASEPLPERPEPAASARERRRARVPDPSTVTCDDRTSRSCYLSRPCSPGRACSSRPSRCAACRPWRGSTCRSASSARSGAKSV